MIHIILLILKILGCIILGILALILAALLVALFVPFRYELSAAYDGAPEAAGKLSWLFGAVKVRGRFKDKKLCARASVLWFRIFSVGEDADKVSKQAEETAENMEDIFETELDKALEISEDIPDAKNAPDKPLSAEAEILPDTEISAKSTIPKEPKISDAPGGAAAQKKAQKTGFGERLSKVFERLSQKISSIEKQYERIARKKELLERFWNAGFTQGSIAFAKKALMSVLRHLRPKKLSGNIHFGFDKPSDTGRILGYASVFYAWYGDSLKLYPDFEETALDGNIDIRGSIQLYIFLYWGLRGLLNKDLRKLLKYIKHYKGKEETLWQ